MRFNCGDQLWIASRNRQCTKGIGPAHYFNRSMSKISQLRMGFCLLDGDYCAKIYGIEITLNFLVTLSDEWR